MSPPWMYTVVKKGTRGLVRAAVVFLPKRRRIAIERWLRGREQLGRLRQADCVVVSYGKSGRTWLRVLLSRFYQVRDGLPEQMLLGFDNFHRQRPSVPRIFFTHDNYLADYTGHRDSKVDYRGRRVVLLVRHPADVAVSQYFQWRHRMKPWKKDLNDYPPHGAAVELDDFVLRHPAGLRRAVAFLNAWAPELAESDHVLLVRYEDLRADTAPVLARIVSFLGTPGTDEQIQEAVRFASFDHMKRLEQERRFRFAGGKMQARDRDDPNSAKVRRGKVGGFRDYLDAKQVSEVEEVVREQLAPVYGYAGTDPDLEEVAS